MAFFALPGMTEYTQRREKRIKKAHPAHLSGMRLRLSKNYTLIADNRAAGEREGARPASRFYIPPQKSLIFQAFWAKQRFEAFKTLGG